MLTTSSMLSTYTYTSSLVASQRYSSLPSPSTSTFPLVFAAAYRNWSETCRKFPLTEACQDSLASLCPSSDTGLALVTRGSPSRDGFCRLTDRSTGRSAVARLCHSTKAPAGLLLTSPASLASLATLLRTTADQVREAKFSYQRCEGPRPAARCRVAALQSPLLARLALGDVDSLLAEHFREARYVARGGVFCVEVRRLVTGALVHLLPLLQGEELLYFTVEELEEEGEEDREGEGLLVCRQVTRLVQSSHARLALPREDVLSNRAPGSPAPRCLAAHLDHLADLRRRHLASPARRGAFCLPVLVAGEEGSGAERLVAALAARLGLGHQASSGRDMVGDTSGATEAHLRREAVAAGRGLTVWVVEEVEVVARDKEGAVDHRALAALQEGLESLPVEGVVVGLCRDLAKVEPALAALFPHHVEVAELEQEDRHQILLWLLAERGAVLEEGVHLPLWARKAAGLNLADLEYLLDYAQDEAAFEEKQEVGERHLQAGLGLLQATRADSLGLATVPSVHWEQVGGLVEAREELRQALDTGAGGRRGRTGVLLYGPPGVGKTLLAKAMATEHSCSFISVKGPELLNMYVGQSEDNVRQVFQRARSAQPCILFFDELDSLAPNRGGSGDGGGVMDRVVSALLAEMDGLERLEVTVVAATNRPDLVDPALLRPGRLDRLVYLGVTDDPAQQLLILRALSAKLQLAADCDLPALAALLPPGLTGADLSSLVSEAAMAAVQRCVEAIEAGHINTLGGVTMKDFLAALDHLRPSVSQEELLRYASLRNTLRK